ncbi:MAG: hypothetical protein WC003_13580, partial [Terrimicrobiaceae bacterium]
ESVELFIGDYVEPGAMVVTGGLSVYDHLKAAGFDHRPHNISHPDFIFGLTFPWRKRHGEGGCESNIPGFISG